ncbi:MAG: helix-turn-helix transcriptional regulator, partial [Prevotellaceae bacterium]|nr:helix-turn-helix transcriptional regulator [Prevotellaceae bacterium]
MSAATVDFFRENDLVGQITEDDYRIAGYLVDAAKAFSRCTHQYVYIIDYYKKSFVHVSENLAVFLDDTASMAGGFGPDFYLRHVPEKEHEMLVEVNRMGFDLFRTIPVEERAGYVIEYDFHLVNEHKTQMVHHKLTPLALTREGDMWLALCTVSFSSRSVPGHYVMRGRGNYYEYDTTNHYWERKEAVTLNEMERNVLSLSAQGFTMNEIAKKLCKSVDTIKACKRALFVKLGA